MPEEKRRRQGEPEYEDPSEQSLIKKAAKMEFGNPVVDALIRVILMLAVGGGAGLATSESKSAVSEETRAEVLRLDGALEALRSGFHQRVDVEEKEREREVTRLRERVTWLEAKLNTSAPRGARTSGGTN